MRRKIMLLLVAAACIGSVVANRDGQVKAENDILLQNVEALADFEIPPVMTHCIDEGSVDCPIAKVKVKYVMSGWNE